MLSKTASKTVASLEAGRNCIKSRNGGWLPGEGVFVHGHRLLEDLVLNKSYMQIVVLNATGRLVSRELADWMEAILGCMSWPDPRIWCNQIGALAGETQATVSAATVAGTLAADSRAYGQGTLVKGVEFIKNALAKQQQGKTAVEITAEEIKSNRGKPNIMGFARPLAQGDERVAAMEKLTEKLGFKRGPHLQLAYDIEAELLAQFGESMNIAGYMSAFLADHNFSASEIYSVYAVSVMSGVMACHVEYADQPAHSFLPLRCDDINYTGTPVRSVKSI
ncbi:citrate synthase [Alteromonadaceae bacterium 2753L.S.0a.02]|nr:citrate synthase [Alteromonadaceae bacterium 2753L.S.0a.02]